MTISTVEVDTRVCVKFFIFSTKFLLTFNAVSFVTKPIIHYISE